MSTAQAGVEGFTPDVKVGTGNPEAQKYGKLWAMGDAYRKESPGEKLAQVFLTQARPKPGSHVLDLGCGTGRGGLMLAVLGQCKVTLLDFVRNCLDAEVEQALTTQAHALRFVKADLEQPLSVVAEYGFCCDTMEHIPELHVDRVLDNILGAAQHVFFSIATTDDTCGALIGERLHMTVRPYAWWLTKLAAHSCVVHWSQDLGESALFYVTAWVVGQDIVNAGVLNTAEERTKANVIHNIAPEQGWAQVVPHLANDVEVMIVGGGPSLGMFEGTITRLRAEGVKLITLNGAYNWALEHGLTPSATIMVDARAFNKRFVQPVVDACKYLISSQCDPSVLEGLPKDRTLLWHPITEAFADVLTARYPEGYFPIPGGSSVLLRAIPLLRMLGFKRFHLFGCDSCLMETPEGEREGAPWTKVTVPTEVTEPASDGDPYRVAMGRQYERLQHHAYAQPENDNALVIPVTVGGRVFRCHAWMVSQAQEFMGLIGALGDEIELEVYGDGLLAHILKTGAEMADLEEHGSMTV